MGFLDVLLGRRKLAQPAADRLFAVSTALKLPLLVNVLLPLSGPVVSSPKLQVLVGVTQRSATVAP